MATDKGRWAGRNETKDAVRGDVWRGLQEGGFAVGPAWSNIPNFVGADMAAWRLAQTDAWRAARTVKCNPDPPQIPVRLRALYDGKLLFAPVPYLTQKTPYVRIDPAKLRAKGVDFETAATAQGYLQHGEPIEFEEVESLDFCVVGSVAVTRGGGRTGKGAGFADLETGIFRELGLIRADTPMATTIHSSQLVDEARVLMQTHDSPLDFVATELELIVTGNRSTRPTGVSWDHVQPDQYEQIPFLTALRDRLLARAASGTMA
jgi:5-formyltetrahydrofolate cyclo-ligase